MLLLVLFPTPAAKSTADRSDTHLMFMTSIMTRLWTFHFGLPLDRARGVVGVGGGRALRPPLLQRRLLIPSASCCYHGL